MQSVIYRATGVETVNELEKVQVSFYMPWESYPFQGSKLILEGGNFFLIQVHWHPVILFNFLTHKENDY